MTNTTCGRILLEIKKNISSASKDQYIVDTTFAYNHSLHNKPFFYTLFK